MVGIVFESTISVERTEEATVKLMLTTKNTEIKNIYTSKYVMLMRNTMVMVKTLHWS